MERVTIQITHEQVEIEYTYHHDVDLASGKEELEFFFESPLPEAFDSEIEEKIREHLERKREEHNG